MKSSMAFLALVVAVGRVPPALAELRGHAFRQAGLGEAAAVAPPYGGDRCELWVAGVIAADADGSGGLSEEEFYAFLQNIDGPAPVRAYFAAHESYDALHWSFRTTHKALACRCQDLGGGAGCCVGDAEIPLVGLQDADDGDASPPSPIGREYRADLCGSLAATFVAAIPTPPPVEGASDTAATNNGKDDDVDGDIDIKASAGGSNTTTIIDDNSTNVTKKINTSDGSNNTIDNTKEDLGDDKADGIDIKPAVVGGGSNTTTIDVDGGSNVTDSNSDNNISDGNNNTKNNANEDSGDDNDNGIDTKAQAAPAVVEGGNNTTTINDDGSNVTDSNNDNSTNNTNNNTNAGVGDKTDDDIDIKAPAAPAVVEGGSNTTTVDEAGSNVTDSNNNNNISINDNNNTINNTNEDLGDDADHGTDSKATTGPAVVEGENNTTTTIQLSQARCCPKGSPADETSTAAPTLIPTMDVVTPVGEGRTSCFFCPDGMTTWDSSPLMGDGASCEQIREYAAALAADDTLCPIVQLSQVVCCPSNAPAAPASTPVPALATSNDHAAVTSPLTAVEDAVLTIVGSVVDYSTYNATNLPGEIPEGLSADEIARDAGAHRVLAQVLEGVEQLAEQVIGEAKGAAREGKRRLQLTGRLRPVLTDIPCPSGLLYAPADGFCVEFAVSIFGVDPSGAANLRSVVARLRAAIDDEGALYDLVWEAHPTTLVAGLGSPGKGQSYRTPTMAAGAPESGGDGPKGISTLWIWPVFAVIAVVIHRCLCSSRAPFLWPK